MQKKSIFKLARRELGDDRVIGIADILLVYTMISPIALNLIGFHVKLSPNSLRTALVLLGPGIIALSLYLLFFKKKICKKLKKIFLYLFAPTAIIIISSYKMWDSPFTRESLKFFTTYCVFGFFLSAISGLSSKRLRSLILIWLLCSLAFLFYDGFIIYSRGYLFEKVLEWPGDNQARLGALHFFFAICAFIHFTISSNIYARVASLTIFSLCFFLGFLAVSRSALLIFFFTFFVYAIYYTAIDKKGVFNHKFSVVALHVLIVMVISCITIKNIKDDRIRRYADFNKLSKHAAAYIYKKSDSAYKDRDSHRLRVWSKAIKEFKTNPILGSGYGATRYYDEILDEYFTHPHNIFLQFLAETGIVGFICFLFFCILIGIRAISNLRNLDTERKFSFVFYPLSLMFFGMLSCLHFAIHENYLAWYFAGMIVGFEANENGKGSLQKETELH
jgi:O-antigen ligase